MAHSFIQAHEDETAAFERFACANPDDVVLLIDTYDTEAGAAKVVSLAPRLREKGIAIQGVRLDSGDLADHARKVRRILDEGGLADAVIFASGNLDESIVSQLLAAQAPIDGFGIGTRMDTSADAPYLDCAYKLEEYGGRPRRKRSEGKATWPGRKQVYRRYDADGRMRSDILTVENDPQEGEPLIRPVMCAGKRLHAPAPLSALRERARDQLARLPHGLRTLEKGPDYPVQVSPALRDMAKAVDEHRL
jgi:nicotinate phosphoribosyltransferase